MDFKILVFFVVSFVFLSGSSIEANVCVVPEVPEAIGTADAVFVGKIVDVIPVGTREGGSSSSSDYLVDFEIEQSWKGTMSKRLRVLWRSEIVGCPTYPVGQTGKTYLVYAEGRKDRHGPNDPLVEVTIFNRTSLIPPVSNGVTLTGPPIGRAHQFVVITPELNRRDASQDISALRQLKECGCLLPNSHSSCSPSTTSWREQQLPALDIPPGESACCACLRRTTKLPFSGFQ